MDWRRRAARPVVFPAPLATGPVAQDPLGLLGVGRFVADHVLELNGHALVSELLRLLGPLRVVPRRQQLGRQHLFDHLPVGRRRGGRPGLRRGLAAEGHDLVRQVLGVRLLVGHFAEEELRPIAAGRGPSPWPA